MTLLKKLWLNGSLWKQKWFFYYGITVKNLLNTFIFQIVTIQKYIRTPYHLSVLDIHPKHPSNHTATNSNQTDTIAMAAVYHPQQSYDG